MLLWNKKLVGKKSMKVTWDSDSRQRPSSRWFNMWCGASLDDYGTHPKGVWSSSTAIMTGSSLRDGLAVARQKTPEMKMRLSEMVAFWVTLRLKMSFIFAFFFLRFIILSHGFSRRLWRLWKFCLFVGFGKQKQRRENSDKSGRNEIDEQHDAGEENLCSWWWTWQKCRVCWSPNTPARES